MTSKLKHPADTRHLHPLETAGRLAVNRVPIALCTDSVAEVRQHFRSNDYEIVDLVLVTDADGRYQGAAELRRVLEADEEALISTLVNRSWPTVAPETDQEHAAATATEAAVSVLPVIAKSGEPVGVLPAVVLLDVLTREHREDVHRLVGILRERAGARHALEDPPLRRVRHRLPWLLVGLALSASAAAVMASYEHALQANVMIAIFIPSLVYLTDAVGTQTEAIAVRGLSLSRKPLPYILWMEILTGGAIGLALGTIALFAIWAVFGSFTAGLGVGISLFAASTLASALGLVLPWTLSRFQIDPAFGSGPVATILQDVLTIIIYFMVMTKLLDAGS